jgi:hypothetical protein
MLSCGRLRFGDAQNNRELCRCIFATLYIEINLEHACLLHFQPTGPSKLPALRKSGPLHCGCLQYTTLLLQLRLDSKHEVSASADGDALEQHFPSSTHDACGSKAGSVDANTSKFLKIFYGTLLVACCTLCQRTERTHLVSRLTDSCYQNKFAPNVTHQPTYGLQFCNLFRLLYRT